MQDLTQIKGMKYYSEKPPNEAIGTPNIFFMIYPISDAFKYLKKDNT